MAQSVDSQASTILWHIGQTGVGWANYQPPQGGRYDLAFVVMFSPSLNEEFMGAKMDGSYVLVSWKDRGCFPFRLLSRKWTPTHSSYVMEKFRCSYLDAEALTDLFNAINEHHFAKVVE